MHSRHFEREINLPENKPASKSSWRFKTLFTAIFILSLVLIVFCLKIAFDTEFGKTVPANTVIISVAKAPDAKAPEPLNPAVQDIFEEQEDVLINAPLPIVPEVIPDEAFAEPATNDGPIEVLEDKPFEDKPFADSAAEDKAEDKVEDKVVTLSKNEDENEIVTDSADENKDTMVDGANTEIFSISSEHKTAYIAIVIDDMGISSKRTKEILSISAPLTYAFLTYGKNLNELLQEASKTDHEIIIHVPMEPKGPASLAPDTLKVSMSNDDIRTMFLNMLAKFKGVHIRGVNNHMGSLFTSDKEKLSFVMKLLKSHGLYFFDSKTTNTSVAQEVASNENVAYIARDVFLDNQNEYNYITYQLQKTEKIASQKGYAVAIGHPKSETYKALNNWVKNLPSDIQIMYLSDIINLKK